MADLNTLPLERAYAELASTGLVRRALELARDEDLGTAGDISSEACIDAGTRGEGAIVAREAGVAAGLAALPEMLRVFGGGLEASRVASDGARVERGARLATISGSLRGILAVERAALNLLGRLSGIATLTAHYVEAAAPGRAQVFDTRKTAPGLRVLEKYAVRCGGGRCHRRGLFDAVLIKDNHLAGVPPSELAPFIVRAAQRARQKHPGLQFVEVEVDSLTQLQELLRLPPGTVDIVLLDNMSAGDLRRAATMRDQTAARPQLEASGGITLDTIGAVAATGVDRVSVGALTHSAPALDVALDIPA